MYGVDGCTVYNHLEAFLGRVHNMYITEMVNWAKGSCALLIIQ